MFYSNVERKWSTGSWLTTRFDHRRLQTSSDCPSPAADQRFCRRHRNPSSSSAPGPPTQLPYVNALFDNLSVSAAVAVEIRRRPVRPSTRIPSVEVAVDLLASSGTSNLVIFVAVVSYVGASSSCRSPSTTIRHSTTSSTTLVRRRRMRPYPLYMSRAHARRLETLICKL